MSFGGSEIEEELEGEIGGIGTLSRIWGVSGGEGVGFPPYGRGVCQWSFPIGDESAKGGDAVWVGAWYYVRLDQ